MVGVVLFSSMRHSLTTAQDQFAAADDMAIDLLSDLARIALMTDDYAEFQAFVEHAHIDSRLKSVILRDTRGHITASSDPGLVGEADAGTAKSFGISAIGRAAKQRSEGSLGAKRQSFLGSDAPVLSDGLSFDDGNAETIRHHTVQLGSHGHLLGTLELEFSDDALMAAHATSLRYGVITAVAGMLVIAAVSLMIGHLLTLRLSRLANVADQVAEGNTALRARLSGGDEVARVGTAFDGMIDRLEQQLDDVKTARDRLILPTEAMCQGFALWDRNDRLVLCNRQFRDLHAGLDIDLSPGLSFENLAKVEAKIVALSEDVEPEHWRIKRHLAHQERMTDLTYQLTCGRWVHLDERATADGGVVAIYTDITDAKERERELFESEERMRIVMNSVSEGIATIGEDGRLEHMNSAFAEIFQQSEEVLLEKRLNDLLFWSCTDDRFTAKQPAVSPEKLIGKDRVELTGVRPSGSFSVELAVRRMEWRRGFALIATVRDVTEQKHAHEMMVHQATHDPLTGLPNRNLFEDRLEQALRNAERTGRLVGVMYLDLDRFKTINDSFGHGIGDELLIGVAERFRAAIRSCDTVARMGGDEFIFIFGDLASNQDTVKPAHKVLDALSEPFRLAGRDVTVGASIGLSIYPNDGWDRATLQRNADAAMYRAKSAGRNRIELYDRSMSVRAAERVSLELDLRRAYNCSEFDVVYQPQFSIGDQQFVGVEALLRWQHSKRGWISPDTFIPIAEESGLIDEIGGWMLEHVCDDANDWQKKGVEVPRIAVNISGRQLNGDLPDLVERLSAAYDLDRKRLEFELSETALLRQDAVTMRTIDQIRKLGISLALDGFGTGYSSLSHLRRYQVDRLKIDRTYIEDMTRSSTAAMMTETIIALARGLGIYVVAKGVQNTEQLSLLRDMQCDEAQGFLFGRPMSAADIAQLKMDRAA